MIRILICCTLLAASVFAAPNLPKSETCGPDNCKLPNCSCFNTNNPTGLKLEETPQFVFFTFEDMTYIDNDTDFIQTLQNKTNPDNCSVAATLFYPHISTYYPMVNQLWGDGHEIALHSITHSESRDYWRNIEKNNLTDEFGGEKKLLAYFANISTDSIKGMRLPYLQLSGDNSFEVAKEIGLQYDCSWETQDFNDPPAWPYTLDYESQQDCPIGPCPSKSIPGLWVVPMVDWLDLDGSLCSMVDNCPNIDYYINEDKVLEWYKTNFNRHYKTNKAPFGFHVHADWFNSYKSYSRAYSKFVDYLQTLEDVYIVRIESAIEWMKNPVPIGSADWPKCVERQASCKKQFCYLDSDQGQMVMYVCGRCPRVYPWLGNPFGR